MAKRRKALPARPPATEAGDEHSLLLRSAESLGRVIGALQRQLDEATRRLGRRKKHVIASNGDGSGPRKVPTSGSNRARQKTKKTAPPTGARKAAASRGSAGARTKRANR